MLVWSQVIALGIGVRVCEVTVVGLQCGSDQSPVAYKFTRVVRSETFRKQDARQFTLLLYT